jgi:hypothetical protein
MVVGIFPGISALRPVVDGLNQAGVDIDRLRVLSCDEIPTELATSGVQYIWIGDVNRGAPSNIMTGGGGTGMPVADEHNTGMVEGDLLESLSELAIPDGRTDDFARAVETGSLVVGYPCIGVDSATLRQLYTSSGASSIDEF